MVFRKIVLILAFVFIIPSHIYANPSVDVPVRHWSYDAIEKLAIMDLADIADIGVRPYSRIKMAYIIKTAIDKSKSYDLDFEWEEQDYLETLLYNLIEEYREELVTIGVEIAAIEDKKPESFIFSPPRLNIKKVYARLDSDRRLFENNDGWDLRDGLNIRLKANSWVRMDNYFAVSLTPGIRFSSEDTDVNFEEGLIRFSHPRYNMELAAGRSPMWWGPGFHGALLMSDNAFPLDTLRWNNIYPFRLPWMLKKIGRFNALLFLSRLEKKRAIPHAYMTGWRLDYTPCDFLKFGFGHVLMFGGKGVKRLGFANFWSSASLVFSAAGGGTETENHIISGDAQFFIRRIDRFVPIATGAKLYTEWGAEDESGNAPVNFASITGIHLTDILKIPALDAKLEFANLDKTWYTHSTYGSGYTRRGNTIGHYIGGDSEEIVGAFIYHLPDKYKVIFSLNRQRRGLQESNVETRDRFRLEFNAVDALDMYNIKDVEMKVFYEQENIEAYNNTSDTVKNNILGAEVKRRF